MFNRAADFHRGALLFLAATFSDGDSGRANRQTRYHF